MKLLLSLTLVLESTIRRTNLLTIKKKGKRKKKFLNETIPTLITKCLIERSELTVEDVRRARLQERERHERRVTERVRTPNTSVKLLSTTSSVILMKKIGDGITKDMLLFSSTDTLVTSKYHLILDVTSLLQSDPLYSFRGVRR
jgi:hypothetical protein